MPAIGASTPATVVLFRMIRSRQQTIGDRGHSPNRAGTDRRGHAGVCTAFVYGAPVPPGPITLNDLYNIIPMNPPVSVVELTGEEVQALLEENLEHSFSRAPYQQMGGYLKRSLGLKMYVKLENPAGCRIQEIFVGDHTLNPKHVYPTTFVTTQGVPSHYGQNRHNLDIHAVDTMRAALGFALWSGLFGFFGCRRGFCGLGGLE